MRSKFICFTAWLLLVAHSMVAQDVWTKIPDFPASGGGRSGALGFAIGNKGYTGMGLDKNKNYYKDLWEYDPASKTWTQKADLPGPGRYGAIAFNIGNKGYAGAGQYNDGKAYSDFYEYDPARNFWTMKASAGGGGRYLAASFSVGNIGYIGTGYATTYRNDFWAYDPASDTWTRKADVPNYGRDRLSAVGFSIGNKGYIGLGVDTLPFNYEKNDLHEYSPVTDTWTAKADFPGSTRFAATGFSINGKGYVGTGYHYYFKDLPLNDFWEFNPSDNTWQQEPAPSPTQRAQGTAFSIGNKGYLGFGLDKDSLLLNDFWEFTAPSPVMIPAVYFDPIAVTTIAGNGQTGFADGAAVSAEFNNPSGIAKDTAGNVYVADKYNNRIRKISTDGMVSTFAGSGAVGFADGTGTAAQFASPAYVAIDAWGNIFVSDGSNHAIRKITPGGIVTTFAGSGVAGYANGTGTAAQFNFPQGIAVDKAGNIYVADNANHRIRKISPDAVVTTFAGSGVSGTADGNTTDAQFIQPRAVAPDASGNVYVSDFYAPLRKISASGMVSTIAAQGFHGGIAVDPSGNIFTPTILSNTENYILKITVSGTAIIIAGGTNGFLDSTGNEAKFSFPDGIAMDDTGNIYVADEGNNRIRKMSKPAMRFATEAGNPSPVQFFSISSNNLNGLPALLKAPEGYEFALTEAGPWNTDVYIGTDVASFKIGIRLKGTVPAGNYNGNVSITATGATGQQMYVSGMVTDTTPPRLQCPASQFFCYSNTKNYTVPATTASDISGIRSISYAITGATFRSGSGNNASGLFNPGRNIIVWAVTDNAGNTSNCQTIVRINQPLAVTVPDVYPLLFLGQVNTLYTGFGPTAVTITANPSGGTKLPGNNYTYTWSNGAGSKAITVSPSVAGDYKYSVTITDSLGCQATIAKTIHVVDVRCGNKMNKVLVCWPYRFGNIESCVNDNQAFLALLFGARLGSCGNSTQRSIEPGVTDAVKGISIFPNPNNGSFVLQLTKLNNVELRVLDQSGRIISRQVVNGGNNVQRLIMNLGRVANGLYLVEAISKEAVYTTKMLVQQ